MIICLILHIIILIIAFFGFVPYKHYNNLSYFELFQQSAPKFYKTFAWILPISVFYYIGYNIFFYYNYIDNFNSFICIISIFAIAAVLCVIFYFIFKDEILYPTDDFKSDNKFLIPSMFLYLYASSIIYSCGIVYFTNSFLDFRTQEDKTVTIGEKQYTTGAGKSSRSHFDLYISPTIDGLNPIDVPSNIYWEAKKGDKLKIHICKGLFGQRYLSNKMFIIK